MGFKENLLKKIDIDQTAKKILSTIGTPDSDLKIDKNAVRHLLEMSPYQYQKERDLDLYILRSEGDKDKILVLDNELPIYRTTPEDVGLRKSPTIKEMVSFRNAKKILSDKDVKLSRKEASVALLREDCISLLDLSFNRSDIDNIRNDGITSLEREYMEGIVEALILFSALLGYQPVPKMFRLPHNEIYGKFSKKPNNQYILGPVVMYNKMENSLKMYEGSLSGENAQIAAALTAVSSGKEKATFEGPEVFNELSGRVEIKPLFSDEKSIDQL